MTTEQYDADLKTLVKEKFSSEDLEKIRLDIVLLLDKECEKHDLSDNQSYLFGCIVLDAIQNFYKGMTCSSYSLDEERIKRLIDTYTKAEEIFFPRHKIKYEKVTGIVTEPHAGWGDTSRLGIASRLKKK